MPARAVAAAAALVLALALAVALGWAVDGTDDDGPGSRAASPAATPSPPERPAPTEPAASTAPPTAPSTPSAPSASAPPSGPGLPPAGVDEDADADTVVVRYRVEVRTGDEATRGATDVVEATLSDPRGWSRAGFRLVRDDSPSAPFVVVLAEADEVDRLCLPYETSGRWSCQNGPVVALNADRWRTGTPTWTGDLRTYRQMLVNHEVGHLLGMRHPPLSARGSQCPEPGRPALVMSQQSTELDGCLPNPWPLDGEVERAARHDQPLAPPYGR